MQIESNRHPVRLIIRETGFLKKPGFLGAGVAFLLVTALLGAPIPAQTPATVTLVHFNDVYEIDGLEGGRIGGLARAARAIAGWRRSATPVITTLGGDFLSPSAIGAARVDGEALAGRQMVDVLNACGLDWATLGNHEFDVSEAQFRARMKESAFGIVSSNVTETNGLPFAGIRNSAVVTVQSGGRPIRLGLIGLTIDANKKPWVAYQPVVPAARAAVAELAGKVDAIVALTHLTLAGDADVVTAVPEIDLVLGGHEHDNWLMRRGPHFTPVIKADANVRSLAIVTLTFGAAGTRPAVESRLQFLDASVTPEPSVQARVSRWMTTAFDGFRRDGFVPEAAVATSTEMLDGRESTVRNRPARLTEIIANAMAREAGAEVGILNGGSIRIDDELAPGVLTQYDIIRVLPFGGRVVRATLDGALLTRVLDTGLGNQGTGGYLHTNTGVVRRSSGWFINEVAVDPARRYTVGIYDFLLTGAEINLGFLTRTDPRVQDVQDLRDVRLAVIDELKRVYP